MRIRIFLALALAAIASVARAAPDLDVYGQLPAISAVSLSPSGDRFAVVAVDKGLRSIYVRRSDGQALAIANLGPSKVRDIVWAGDDHVIVFASATVQALMDGIPQQEWTMALNMDLAANRSTVVFSRSRTFMDAVFGWYGAAKIDGKWYGYFGSVTQEALRSESGDTIYPDLTRVELSTNQAVTVARGSSNKLRWVVGPDGAILGHSGFDPRSKVWTLFAGPGDDRPILRRQAPEGGVSLIGPGRAPGTLVVSEDDETGDLLREVSAAGGEGEILMRGDSWSSTLHDPDKGLLIGAAMHEGLAAKLFDNGAQARVEAALKAFPKLRAQLSSFSRDFGRMVVFTDGPENSGVYWLVDIVKRSAVPIGGVYPQVKAADVGPMRVFEYKAADGLAMDGVLTVPPGREARNLPLVVLPHGGPITWGDGPGFDWWAQAFASRGYAVFQPNYRGTLGRGEAFRYAAFGEMGRKMQTDITDGVAALAKEGIVDAKRVCIVGASYGGYAALMGVTAQQGHYRCAVSVAGVADLKRLIFWDRSRSADQRSVEFWRNLSGAAEGLDLDTISPAKLADRADAPVLLIHGQDDTVVPIDQSEQMRRALKGAGRPVEMLTMKGEDHWLSQPDTRLTMLKSAVAFVESHNPVN